MEQARHARAWVSLYDIGFPLPRSWLFGIAGFIVVIATFAIGYFIASRDRPAAAASPEPTIAADVSADDVLVARAVAEPPKHFPAFAPEGVIVVQARSQERAFAEARIEQPSRRVENARRPPVAVARAEARAQELAELSEEARPETRADERPARNEAPPVREQEAEYADAEAEGSANRSWYGSEEYWREVRERRRAEREAQRRQ